MMAENKDTKHETDARPAERKDTRRNLNANIAQRQKLLLAGIGGVALLAGAWFILDDDDSAPGDSDNVASIDTGGLVNRNLSQREFVATYGNRLDAQGRAIKDLQDTQLPRPEIEQELEALRAENARMISDGQVAIDAISVENAALRTELERSRETVPAAPAMPPPPYGPGVTTPGEGGGTPGASATRPGGLDMLTFGERTSTSARSAAAERVPALMLEASRDYLPPNCSDKFLGVCLTKRKAYCCFESKLSRILQEQGRAQLPKPWDEPKEEQCEGFTLDEFAQLDLSQMDFSEVYAEFTEAARLPDELETSVLIQQKIEDYYARSNP